jgi:hypothetical protein
VLWPARAFGEGVSPATEPVGKRTGARRSGGLRAYALSGLKRVLGGARDSPRRLNLKIKVGTVPALVDTGAQFSCLRADVAEYILLKGEPCSFNSCSVECTLANGKKCDVKDAVRIHVKVLSYSWTYEFKVLRGDPARRF